MAIASVRASGRVLGTLLFVGVDATAQCTNPWLPAAVVNNNIEATAVWDPDGVGPLQPHLVIGGAFTMVGTVAAARVAAWNPATGAWAPLGSGMNGTVNELRAAANGDLIAVGLFTSAGGVPCSSIARWHAGAWQAVGSGVGGAAQHVVETSQGALVVTGLFSPPGSGVRNVAWYSGGTWSYAATEVNPGVGALAQLADGSVVVSSSSGLHLWTPSGLQGWASLAGPTRTILGLRAGGLVAAGSWVQLGATTVNYIARWDGANWLPLGNGLDFTFPSPLVEAIAELPGGDLVIAGQFGSASGVPCANLARWNGATWTPFGAGTNSTVSDVAFLPQGMLAVGGYFTAAGGSSASRLAFLGTTCAGTATVVAAGCASSGGANQLAAEGVPWLGGTFATNGTGLPSTSLALVVHGLQAQVPALPLTQLLPPSSSGCDLHVVPALLDVVLPTGGFARATLAIPPSPAALGATLFQQWLPLEFGGGGSLLATTATNALQFTIGAF